MGNKGSKLDTDRIGDMATEVCTSFSKEFSNAYKDCVAQKIKRDHSESDKLKPDHRLLNAPPGDQFIKTGFLIKLGGQVHNWKRRYFIAMNKADNFAFVYSENENTTTVKGKFHCFGYTVVPFTKEELSTFGIYGMKLTPPDPTKRQWYIRAKNLEEYKQWFEVFSNACRKTLPASGDLEAMKSQAFKIAYRNLRASYGFFGIPNVFGSELDLLEIFVFRLLRRELLDGYLEEVLLRQSTANKRPDNGEEESPEEVAVMTTMATIRPIIFSSWKESIASAEVMRTSFESSLIPIFDIYVTTEATITGYVSDRIQAVAKPVIDDGKETIINPILQKLLPIIITAYEQAIQSLASAILETIDPVSERPENLLREVSPTDGLLEQIDAGPLAQSQNTLRTMSQDDLLAFTAIIEKANLNAFDVYLTLMDSLRAVSRNALYSFTSAASASLTAGPESAMISPSSKGSKNSPEERSPSPSSKAPRPSSLALQRTPAVNPLSKKRAGVLPPPLLRAKLIETLNDTIVQYGEDSKRFIVSSLKSLLLDLLEYSVQERLIVPCAELALQYSSKIPKNLSSLISFPNVIERYSRKLVEVSVTEALDEAYVEISSRLDALIQNCKIVVS